MKPLNSRQESTELCLTDSLLITCLMNYVMKYELEPDWEAIQTDAHLAVARQDAGMPLGEVDARVSALVNKHSPD